MPIEIKELHIKTIVGEETPAPRETGSGTPEADRNLRSKIVEECVEQVMEILKEKNER